MARIWSLVRISTHRLHQVVRDTEWRIAIGCIVLFVFFGFLVQLRAVPELPLGDLVSASDRAIAHRVVGARTDTGVTVALWITALCDKAAALSVAGLLVIVLVWARSRHLVPFAITFGGTATTVWITKLWFERERPSADIAHYILDSFSFPSGHAALAIALYGYIACMMWVWFRHKIARRAVVSGAVILIGAIAMSRVYLGVHFASDVIAGLLVGGMWLLVGMELYKNGYARTRIT
jgi:undecaprenyl-diphosphatase